MAIDYTTFDFETNFTNELVSKLATLLPALQVTSAFSNDTLKENRCIIEVQNIRAENVQLAKTGNAFIDGSYVASLHAQIVTRRTNDSGDLSVENDAIHKDARAKLRYALTPPCATFANIGIYGICWANPSGSGLIIDEEDREDITDMTWEITFIVINDFET